MLNMKQRAAIARFLDKGWEYHPADSHLAGTNEFRNRMRAYGRPEHERKALSDPRPLNLSDKEPF